MDSTWLRYRIHPPQPGDADASTGAIGEEPILLTELLEALAPGQELWYFESPQETWDALCGRAGYAIVQGGRVVDTHMTAIN